MNSLQAADVSQSDEPVEGWLQPPHTSFTHFLSPPPSSSSSVIDSLKLWTNHRWTLAGSHHSQVMDGRGPFE